MTDLSDFVRFCESRPQPVKREGLDRSKYFLCGHEKTPENSRHQGFTQSGTLMIRCVTCHRENSRKWSEKRRQKKR